MDLKKQKTNNKVLGRLLDLKKLCWLVGVNLLVLLFLGSLLTLMSPDLMESLITIAFMLSSCAVIGATLFFAKNTQSTLIKSQSMNQLMMKSTHPILITDSDNNVVAMNVAFEHAFENTQDVINGWLEKKEIHERLNHENAMLPQENKIVIEYTDKLYELTIERESQFIIWKLCLFDSEDIIQNKIRKNAFLKYLNLNNIFNDAPAGNVILDEKGVIQAYNDTFLKIFLKDHSKAKTKKFIELLSEDNKANFMDHLASAADEKATQVPIEIQFSDQHNAVVFIKELQIPQNYEGTEFATGYFLQTFDNNAQKTLQQSLIQSQKQQALGQLAGGIAHDFNNLLTAMIGFCDLILSRSMPYDQSFTDVMQIKQNANRAANLVKQLLAFSRQQTLQPQVLDISDSLEEISILLQRLLGPSINLDIIHGSDLSLVQVDKNQFEQVIINLVVNARDAIGESGSIVIKTANKSLDHPVECHADTCPAGEYVMIEVIDSGCGITDESLGHIFDPFYTTKEMGSGTGLGLATVYGIIKQTGGSITVNSKLGQGTQFNIYLPRSTTSAIENTRRLQKPPEEFKDLTGTETILLVEDEDAVRMFAARALKNKGYNVLEARHGLEGLEFLQSSYKNNDHRIDLLITDVVMPEMDGPTLVKNAMEFFPNLEVIYISGYAEDSFREKVGRETHIHFLSKPFSLKQLASKVKEILEKEKQKNQSSSTLSA